jgi:tetratricopeptide (TPR) repeat protein
MITQAVELLEAEPHGPELVSAYGYLAGNNAITGRFAEAVAAGERGIALAKELGLPEPPFAFNFRGFARCELGDQRGTEDIRHALELALEQGLGREVGVIYGYLDWTGGGFNGPAATLELIEEGIAFCERRGITEIAFQLRSARPAVLAELGQAEQALAEAGPISEHLEAAGDIAFVYPRTVQLWLHAQRGTPEDAPSPEELLATAREMNKPMELQAALMSVAHLLFARGEAERARTLLYELDGSSVTSGEYVYGLAEGVRLALALGDQSLARRLTAGIKPITPLRGHALASARAQLAEAAGDRVQAASKYADAAERWREFGNVPERAYALLGQGRCLVAVGDAGAEVPLAEARSLFLSMGYKPALAETEKLLAEAIAQTA